MEIALSPKPPIRSSRNLRIKQRPPLALRGWAIIALNQIQHGWRPPSWKSLWRHHSAADDPIPMKFGTLTETTCRWQRKGHNWNRKQNFNTAAVTYPKPEVVMSSDIVEISADSQKPVSLCKSSENRIEIDPQTVTLYVVERPDFFPGHSAWQTYKPKSSAEVSLWSPFSIPSPFLNVGPLNPAKRHGARCKLPQRGLGGFLVYTQLCVGSWSTDSWSVVPKLGEC